jgi:hypothetical protein
MMDLPAADGSKAKSANVLDLDLHFDQGELS